MLKRIAVTGCPSEGLTARADEALKRGIQLVEAPSGDSIPPGTTAVVQYTEDDGYLETASQLAMAQQEMLFLLAQAIDCREAFRPGSSERVASHATRFAQAVGLSTDEQFTLERGALLRGIGKLNIANEVLLKEGVLTYDEWVLIQQHTNIGADMVRQMVSLRDIEPICRGYHECYDGDGYPNRLEGDEIPLMARMVRILDVYCAMTSPRHYRQTVASHEQAVELLKSERGKHFDPDLVDAFIEKNVGVTDAAG